MEELLKDWTHGAYGILQSLWISRAVRLGNVRRLQQNIEDLYRSVPSNLGFASAVPTRPFRSNSIRVNDTSEDAVVEMATRATVNLLLLSLVVVFDELAAGQMAAAGHPQKRMPGNKASWLLEKLPQKYLWAARGVTELIAIRNTLVHGRQVWKAKGIKMLEKAGVDPLPAVGSKVEPGVEDILRYRRAVRTVLNQIDQIPNKGKQATVHRTRHV